MRRFLPIAALLAVLLLYGLTVATGSGSSLAEITFSVKLFLEVFEVSDFIYCI